MRTLSLAIAAIVTLPGSALAAGPGPGWLLFFEAGGELFDDTGYAVLEPGFEYHGTDLAVALGGPWRIGRGISDGAGGSSVRQADVDELSDIGALVRLLAWGDDGDTFRVLAGSVPSFTLGAGGVVGGLRPSVDPDHPRAGALVGFDVGALELEALASDVLSSRVFAGRVAVWPWSWLRLGATGAIEPEPVPDADAVQVMGADATVVLYRGTWLTLAPYAEAAGITTEGGGAGLHLGLAVDLRLGAGGETLVGIRGEWRTMNAGYVPRYFDEFHEVERWAYPWAGAPPKHLWARTAPAGQGLYAEARLDLPSGMGASASFEAREGGPWAAAIGADLRAAEGFSLGLLLARRGAADGSELLDLSEDTWLTAESRVDIGGPFYVVGAVVTGYRVPLGETAPKEYASGSLGLGVAVAP